MENKNITRNFLKIFKLIICCVLLAYLNLFSMPCLGDEEMGEYQMGQNRLDQDAQQTLERYFVAVKTQKLDEILSVFSQDASIETRDKTYRGHNEIGEFYKNGILKFTRFYPKPKLLFIKGNEVAVEITLHGDGKKIKVGDFFTVENGLIRNMVVYQGRSEG